MQSSRHQNLSGAAKGPCFAPASWHRRCGPAPRRPRRPPAAPPRSPPARRPRAARGAIARCPAPRRRRRALRPRGAAPEEAAPAHAVARLPSHARRRKSAACASLADTTAPHGPAFERPLPPDSTREHGRRKVRSARASERKRWPNARLRARGPRRQRQAIGHPWKAHRCRCARRRRRPRRAAAGAEVPPAAHEVALDAPSS